MVTYTSLNEFPDRVASGLKENLSDREDYIIGLPARGESFLAKYSKYYVLTDSRFLVYQKAPFGAEEVDSIQTGQISRIETGASTSMSNKTAFSLHGSGFEENYAIRDSSRGECGEQFVDALREQIAAQSE